MDLDEIYARIPDAGCKHLCQDSCTVIPASPAERARMAQAGYPLPPWEQQLLDFFTTPGEAYRCPALSESGACRAYEGPSGHLPALRGGPGPALPARVRTGPVHQR